MRQLAREGPAADELVAAIRSAAGDAPTTSGEPELVLGPRPRGGRREPSDLTPRELEVVTLLAEGLATAGIAERLVLSVKTVRNHVQNAITKLGAHSKLEAVAAPPAGASSPLRAANGDRADPKPRADHGTKRPPIKPERAGTL